MMALALLVGIWGTNGCIQTQVFGKQGFVKELYAFEKSGEYEFVREWYEDPTCQRLRESESEIGTVKLGGRLSGMFITGETYEANFSSDTGVDLGAISVSGEALKVARGMRNSSMRNTMLGIFTYYRMR